MDGKAPTPAVHNLAYLEELYAAWLRQAASVPEPWRRYFEAIADGQGAGPDARLGPSFRPFSIFNPPGPTPAGDGAQADEVRRARLQDRVNQLIRNYRVRGHMIARIDPLGRPRPCPPELELDYYQFTPADLERRVSSETLQTGGPLTVGQILERLRNTYCRSIG